MNRRNGLSGAALVALGAGLLLAGVGCSHHHNSMAEATSRASDAEFGSYGRLERLYDYYPNAQVYRSHFQDRWFWNDGSQWHRTVTLPSHVSIGMESPIAIQLPTSRPYTYHDNILAQHPSTSSLYETLAQLDAEMSEEGSMESFTNDTAIATVPTDF